MDSQQLLNAYMFPVIGIMFLFVWHPLAETMAFCMLYMSSNIDLPNLFGRSKGRAWRQEWKNTHKDWAAIKKKKAHKKEIWCSLISVRN